MLVCKSRGTFDQMVSGVSNKRTPYSFAATEFYCDIEGMPGDAAVDRALAELAFHTKSVRVLGSYRQARPRV